MSSEVETPVPVVESTNINLTKIKADIGEVIKINLTEPERKILTSFTKSPFFTDIIIYLNQIILEGTINKKDSNRIDDFILDWLSNNEGSSLPQPLQFLQMVVVPKINQEFLDESSMPLASPQQRTVQVEQTFTPILDEENLPTYLPKINDLIEREVRRRVKIELKEYNELKLRHNDLIAKMEGISKMFSIKT